MLISIILNINEYCQQASAKQSINPVAKTNDFA